MVAFKWSNDGLFKHILILDYPNIIIAMIIIVHPFIHEERTHKHFYDLIIKFCCKNRIMWIYMWVCVCVCDLESATTICNIYYDLWTVCDHLSLSLCIFLSLRSVHFSDSGTYTETLTYINLWFFFSRISLCMNLTKRTDFISCLAWWIYLTATEMSTVFFYISSVSLFSFFFLLNFCRPLQYYIVRSKMFLLYIIFAIQFDE